MGFAATTPNMQAKLRAVFPSNAERREFQRKLLIEARMVETNKVGKGSQTAGRLTQVDEAMQPARAVSAIANAATGRFEPALNWLGRKVSPINHGMTPAVANEYIRIGMSRDPREIQRIYEKAMRQASEVPAERAALARQLIMGSSAASTGNERR